jgi:alpha-galactosidase
VTTRQAIAIDQDPLGVQGRRVAQYGGVDVWLKPLADGDRAVALLNRGPLPAALRLAPRALGFGRRLRLRIRDVWARRTRVQAGPLEQTLAPDSAVLLRIGAA